jgi:hypothetical protein
MQDIITSPRAASPLLHEEWVTIFITIASNIWLAQNRKVFDNINTSPRRLEDNCWNILALCSGKITGKQLDCAASDNRII